MICVCVCVCDCVCVCVCACLCCMCVRSCVCLWEQETDRQTVIDRQTDIQTHRERERELTHVQNQNAHTYRSLFLSLIPRNGKSRVCYIILPLCCVVIVCCLTVRLSRGSVHDHCLPVSPVPVGRAMWLKSTTGEKEQASIHGMTIPLYSTRK